DNALGTPMVTTPPAHGMTTVNGDGTITYTPAPDYNGPDSYIYTICDPQPLCDTAIVHINVSPVNDAPIANVDYVTTPEDMPVTTDVRANDSDVDNPLGTPTVTTPPANGMTTVNGDGTITYTPAPNYNGPDSYIYTLCDPEPLCDTAIVHINVTPEGVLSIICPDDLVLECGSGNYVAQINAWISSVSATGGCGGNITITTNYDGTSIPPLSCNLSTGLVITFTATDQCNTTATCVRSVYLDDTQSPMLTPGEIDACYNTLAEAVDAAIDATGMTDNCAAPGDLVVTYALGDGPFCDTLITLTVSDACGNSASTTYQTRINCQVIRLKVWLEGPYDTVGDSMKTTMNEQHTLPGQLNASPFIADEPAGQPYDGAPWNYNGNSGNSFGDGGGMTPYPADVVDWILVMVRHEGILPANTIWTCAGWVHKDGNVTFPENCPPPAINPNDDYYFVVQHRNHLGILSPSFVNINCGGEVLEWDFRTSDSYKPIFRVGQKVLESGVWGMYDSNGEQIQSILAINSADRTLWVQWQGYSGYSPGDYNLDAFTDSFDETVWKNNQNRTTGVVFY
ncbi:MAG TPA: cadherin-like domain-containing protein, partial [Saprospiraceae bacterium]|nr:cadherin-like domain-containing protein [Saprospiraceae bacterium]